MQQGGEQRTGVTGGKAQRTYRDTQTGQHDRDIDTLSAGQQLSVLHAVQGTRMQGGQGEVIVEGWIEGNRVDQGKTTFFHTRQN